MSTNKIPAWLVVSLFAGLLNAEDMRDYYSEAGANPFKAYESSQANESVDPFSGQLSISHVDVVLPGNGGMDIEVTRYYNAPNGRSGYIDGVGFAWTMHQGRVIVSSTSGATLCPTQSQEHVNGNPSFERPDGSREILFYDDVKNDGTLISKSNWRARCIDPADWQQGMIVTSPDGRQYKASHKVFYKDSNWNGQIAEAPAQIAFYVTEIKDLDANTISIGYKENKPLLKAFISEITADNDRTVKFDYVNENGVLIETPAQYAAATQVLVKHVVVDGNEYKKWTYNYDNGASATHSSLKFFQLASVVRPDGSTWQYFYNPESFAQGEPAAGSLALNRIINPQSGVIEFTYERVNFYQYFNTATNQPDGFLGHSSNVVKTKTVIAKTGDTASVWSYAYTPRQGTSRDDLLAKTVITNPDASRVEYYHYGFAFLKNHVEAVTSENLWWMTGLNHSIRKYDKNNELVEKTENRWIKRQISNQHYNQSPWPTNPEYSDNATYVPMQEVLAVTKYDPNDSSSSENVTTYRYLDNQGQMDIYGNPRQIFEGFSLVWSDDVYHHLTEIDYYNDEVKWVIGKPKTTQVFKAEIVNNAFQKKANAVVESEEINAYYPSNGRLKSTNTNGALSQYEYDTQGNLSKQIDPLNNVTNLSNYYRGVVRSESLPEGKTITRETYTNGTIKSINTTQAGDSRNLKREFEYDSLNRLSKITYPLNLPVSINWETPTKRVLTRGGFQDINEYDGLGRILKKTTNDTANARSIVINTQYDELGNKRFESNPNSADGTTYEYDGLNRVTKIIYPDTKFTKIDHKTGFEQVVTDTNNYVTHKLYRSRGASWENPELIGIFNGSGASGISGTIIRKNILSNTEKVTQGSWMLSNDLYSVTGKSRQYFYDAKKHLEYELHDEIGSVINGLYSIKYVNDDVGNVVEKTVGSLVTEPTLIYDYDGLNQLRTISKGGGAIKTFTYNSSGKLKSLSTPATTWEYQYDNNDNLLEEKLTLAENATPYVLSYGFNTLDQINSITYPSGKIVTPQPDAFGWLRALSPYASAIDYYATGNLKQLAMTNGTSSSFVESSRGWLTDIDAVLDATVIEDLTYGYDGEGNVTSITDGRDAQYTRSMTYDALNRMDVVNGQWGAYDYGYDEALGAIDFIAENGVTNAKDYFYSANRITQFKGINKTSTMEYTNRGAINKITSYTGVSPSLTKVREETYVYDDLNNLTDALVNTNPGNLATADIIYNYTYDGHDRRVKRTQTTPALAANSDQVSVYNAKGQLIGDYRIGTTIGKEYIYLGNKMIASASVNEPPVIDIAAPKAGVSNTTANLQATVQDYDGSIVSYKWINIANPSVILSTTNALNATLPTTSTVTTVSYKLEVTDDEGDVGSKEVTLTVYAASYDSDADGMADWWEINQFGDLSRNGSGDFDSDGITDTNEFSMGTNPTNKNPTIAITAPAPNTLVTSPASLTFNAQASDPEQGNISASIVWSSDIQGALGAGSSKTIALKPGRHEISAKITDAGMSTVTAVLAVEIEGCGSPYLKLLSFVANGLWVNPNSNSYLGSISADGAVAIFPSTGSFLSADTASDYLPNRLISINNLNELTADKVSREVISSIFNGGQPNAEITRTAISGDGKIYVLQTRANNFYGIDDDTNNSDDIYVVKCQAGCAVSRILNLQNQQFDSPSKNPIVSKNGKYVVFANGTNLFRYEVEAGRIEYVDNYRSDVNVSNDSYGMSDDGMRVVFQRNNFIESANHNLYVHDFLAGSILLVNLSEYLPGSAAWQLFENPRLSGNGKFIAFISGQKLLPVDDDNFDDVYLFDIQKRQLTLQSVNAKMANIESMNISRDGRYIAMSTQENISGNNLYPTRNNVWIRDVPNDVYISAGANSYHGGFSDEGSSIVLTSMSAANYGSGWFTDPNVQKDIFNSDVMLIDPPFCYRRDPAITINFPVNNSSYLSSEAIKLDASSFIASGSGMSDNESQIEWVSSIDGLIGSGGRIENIHLSPGAHLLTAYVKNSLNVRGVHTQEISLIIVPDLDSDGMDDQWEFSRFGSITSQNSTTDFDGDGILDLIEYQKNTDPNNAPPMVTLLNSNSNIITVPFGSSLSLAVHAYDREDGIVSSQVSWFYDDALISTGESTALTFSSSGRHSLLLRVSDSAGLITEKLVAIDVDQCSSGTTESIMTMALDSVVDMSADARFVIGTGSPDNFFKGDGLTQQTAELRINARNQLYLFDRQTNNVTLISKKYELFSSVISGSTKYWYESANQPIINAKISGNGKYIVFESQANNLAYLHTDYSELFEFGVRSAFSNIYLYNNDPASADYQKITLVSQNIATTDGISYNANNASTYPVISYDGEVIAYESYASNLATTNGQASSSYSQPYARVIRYLRSTKINSYLVTNNSSSFAGDKDAVGDLSISPSGRYIAYVSDIPVTGGSDTKRDVFRYDFLAATKTRRVTASSSNASDYLGVHIDDAGKVYFSTDATNIVPSDTALYNREVVSATLSGTTFTFSRLIPTSKGVNDENIETHLLSISQTYPANYNPASVLPTDPSSTASHIVVSSNAPGISGSTSNYAVALLPPAQTNPVITRLDVSSYGANGNAEYPYGAARYSQSANVAIFYNEADNLLTENYGNSNHSLLIRNIAATCAPKLIVSAPTTDKKVSAGTPLQFTAQATDYSGGNISPSILWSSDLAGSLFVGNTFTTSALGNGVHTITASVTDSQNKTRTQTRRITVSPMTAPVVTLTAPATNMTVLQGASVFLQGSATDADDGDLSKNLRWISSLTGQAGVGSYRYLSSLSAGVHNLTATVTDSDGMTGTSSAIQVTVLADTDQDGMADEWEALYGITDPNGDADGDGQTNLQEYLAGTNPVNQPPVLTITSPTNGVNVLSNRTITFTATATDQEDGNLAANVQWSSNLQGNLGSGSTLTRKLSVGQHHITATVQDSAGNLSVSYVDIEVVIPGDANNDGDVDLKDLLIIQRHLSGQRALTAAENTRVDLAPVQTGNGVIDTSDLLLLQRIMIGLDYSTCCGQTP